MRRAPITRKRIDELLRFLPEFERPDEDLAPKWHGLDAQPKDGVLGLPYPEYPRIVEEFFRLAGEPCWSDYGYKPEVAGRMIECDATIATASLAEIKTMLTYCVRGERFGEGHWEGMIRRGRIVAILRRLAELRNSAQ